MQRIFAIVWLTWKAAFRYRLFWIITFLMLAAVVGLPILVKDDGTVEGFAQILITYTLGAVTGLLGLCTLWLACGTLAKDMEECQIQMIAVKPVGRWQIWIGKWLGIVSLNAALLALAGLSVYGLLEYRARKLPAAEREKLQSSVLVARASVREENLEPRILKEAERQFKERMEKHQVEDADPRAIRDQIYQQVRAEAQAVPPGGSRIWQMHMGSLKDSLKDQPLYLRVNFITPQVLDESATYPAAFIIGTPKKTPLFRENMTISPKTFHEFEIPPNLIDDDGNLTILFGNPNQTTIVFTLEEGMEVLYKQGGFAENFAKALGVILFWMALLAALGLAAASLMSFPVAAFFSVAVLLMSLCSNTLSTVVSDGTIMGWDSEKNMKGHTAADTLIVPAFSGILSVVNMVQQYSPVESLSEGRCITWKQFGLAAFQVVVLLSGLLAVIGIFIFNRRELATAQGNH